MDLRDKEALRDLAYILIPFGGVESPNAQIAWPPDDNPVMSVLGFDAALCSAESVLLPGDQTLAVIDLPMQGLLKLFAWEDRNLDRPRTDAVDLLFVLNSAIQTTAGLERLLDEEPGLFALDDFDLELAGAWLFGSQARQAVGRCSRNGAKIIARATAILELQTDPDGPLGLIGEVQAANPERARLKLAAFLNGLQRVAALHKT
jgi:predicted nucleotidyltransferase